MITFKNCLQSGKISKRNDIGFSENDPSTRQQYEDDMKLRLKTAWKRFGADGA